MVNPRADSDDQSVCGSAVLVNDLGKAGISGFGFRYGCPMAITGAGPLSRERAKVEAAAKRATDEQEAKLAAIDGAAALPLAIEWLRSRKRDELNTQPDGSTLALISIADSLARLSGN